MKKLLTLFLSLIASVGTIFAVVIQVDGLYYDLDAMYKTAAVTYNSDGYSGDIVIPQSITYVSMVYSVTNIGNCAFENCTGLISVTIPNSVKSIGQWAFHGCTGLTSMTVPDRVKIIDMYAFEGCTGLTSVTIGNSVTSIKWGAFKDCTRLSSITIPNSVTIIGSYSFSGCTDLTYVTMGNSVTEIGDVAFRGCTGLTSIEIPNSVTGIGSGAFSSCIELISINVASNNLNYCSVDGVLFNKSKTTLIQYPGGKQGAYNIPSSITSIESGAFSDCAGLTSVTIGNSVTEIGDAAFSGCLGLTSIDVSANNPKYCSIDGVLFNKSKTTLIQYPAGKQSTTYTIPNCVTKIGDYAFKDCTSFTSITCEAENPPTLGWSVFDDVTQSIPLYVPAGSVEAYKTAYKWKNFTNIQAINPEGINMVFSAQKDNSTKLLRNGQLFILRGDKAFNASGVRVK